MASTRPTCTSRRVLAPACRGPVVGVDLLVCTEVSTAPHALPFPSHSHHYAAGRSRSTLTASWRPNNAMRWRARRHDPCVGVVKAVGRGHATPRMNRCRHHLPGTLAWTRQDRCFGQRMSRSSLSSAGRANSGGPVQLIAASRLRTPAARLPVLPVGVTTRSMPPPLFRQLSATSSSLPGTVATRAHQESAGDSFNFKFVRRSTLLPSSSAAAAP